MLKTVEKVHQKLKESYQMKGEIVNLMEGLPADLTLEGLLIVVRQLVVFVVALLVEALAAKFALVRLVAGVDAHVGVQRGAPIEGLAAVDALMRFLRRVDDLVAAKGGRLAKALSADLADEGPGAGVHRHVSRQVVVGVEDLAALRTGEGLVGCLLGCCC